MLTLELNSDTISIVRKVMKVKNKTYKTITLPLNRLTTKDKDYLFNCNRECAKVWNECIRLNKELWEKEQKYIDRKYLQDRIKGDFSCIIPVKTMQLIIKKYLSNIKGIQEARNKEELMKNIHGELRNFIIVYGIVNK